MEVNYQKVLESYGKSRRDVAIRAFGLTPDGDIVQKVGKMTGDLEFVCLSRGGCLTNDITHILRILLDNPIKDVNDVRAYIYDNFSEEEPTFVQGCMDGTFKLTQNHHNHVPCIEVITSERSDDVIID